ncbi:MAG: hypothetical protein II841_04915 [Bacteroidales bacterium]|nr:hypothetical protein [Bacteroidales bacterium]
MALQSGTHITDTTYAIKYYWRSVNVKGETVSLYIYAKGYRGAPLVYRICDLVSLKLNVQGDQGGVDQPIVKTSLQITLIDSYDAPAAAIGTEYFDGVSKYVYEKHGGWEEFFTPDATKYIVQVYVTANADSEYSESRCVWQGYITPDSWHESLSYRGSVTITARDNLGHLADFDFDMAGNDWGLVRVSDIIDGALTKIKFPLRNYWAGENDFRAAMYAVGTETDDPVGLLDLRVNVSAFEGLTWWDALESVIDSIGCVFRYTDYNAFYLMPLRHMPDMGWAEEEPKTILPEMEFYGGSRMLDPGYKEIVEKVDFGQSDKLEYQSADFPKPTITSITQSASFVLEFKNEHRWLPYPPYEDSFTAAQGEYGPEGTGGQSKSIGNVSGLFASLNPDNYDLDDRTIETEGEGFRNYLFWTANRGTISINGSNTSISYNNTNHGFHIKAKSTRFNLKVEFATPAGFDSSGKLGAYPLKLWKLKYQIYYEKDGVTRHWTGDSWINANYYYIEKEYDPQTEDVRTIEENLIECADVGEYGTLHIIVNYMVYRAVSYGWIYNNGYVMVIDGPIGGVYARLKSISLESSLTKKMVSDTTKTVNNADYNVRCSRNPKFGCLSQSVGFVYPSNYKNAFFYMDVNDYPQAAPYLWKWSDRSTQLGFPVQIAMQILQYHAVPLEVLEGVSGMVSKVNRFTFDDAYVYKSVAHLLLSGVYDFMTGRFDSVIFRAWTSFSNVSTRSAVQAVAANSGGSEEEPEEQETVEDGVTAVKMSDKKLLLLEKVQTADLAETVEEETEEQETAVERVYETPVLSSGELITIEDDSLVDRTFVTRELADENENLNP